MDKSILIALLLVAMTAIGGFIMFSPAPEFTEYRFADAPSGRFEELPIGTAVCVYYNGVLTAPCSRNNITNAGLNWSRDVFGNYSFGNMDSIALGNTSNAESGTLTSLPGQINNCGLLPAHGTFNPVADSIGNYSVSNIWTATCANVYVNTSGLYNQSAPGTGCSTGASANCTMLSGKNFTSGVNLTNIGDQINVTWYIWFTR